MFQEIMLRELSGLQWAAWAYGPSLPYTFLEPGTLTLRCQSLALRRAATLVFSLT